MKKQKIIKLLYIEDSIVKKAMFDSIKCDVEDDYPKHALKSKAMSLMGNTSGEQLEKLAKAVRWADVVVFDYGGLCMSARYGFKPGGYAAIDYWNRLFINWIRETPSKDWRCISAVDTYDYRERKELEQLGVNFRW